MLGLVLGPGCIAGGGYLISDGYWTVVTAEETDAVVRDSRVSGVAGADEYRVHVTYEYTHGRPTLAATSTPTATPGGTPAGGAHGPS